MELSESQVLALRNLARKQDGQDVDWIRIADALALTDLGLANRTREGWNITLAGVAALEALGWPVATGPGEPTPFRRK